MSAIAKVEDGELMPVQPVPISVRTDTSIMEEVIAKGDLSQLKADERARYYMEVCRSLGLNPLTKPFAYIELNKQLTLYTTRTATDQLRQLHGVTIFQIDERTEGDLRIVRAYARDAHGREDMDIGVVNVKGLGGEFLANAYMKAMTKAKRRVTLSICGLGWLDESETDSIPNAQRITVNVETGEIIESDPVASSSAAGTGTTSNGSLDWTGFWRALKTRGVDAGAFEAMTGRQARAWGTPEVALRALDAAEGLIDATGGQDATDAADQTALFDGSDPDRFMQL